MSGMLKEQHSGQWGWELSEQGEENRGLGGRVPVLGLLRALARI